MLFLQTSFTLASQTLSRDTISAAFQLIEFHRAGHKFAQELLVSETLQTAQAITATNFCPAKHVVAKARETRNSSSDSPRYPSAWPVDKTLLREAISSFNSNTETFRTTQTFRNFDWHILTAPPLEDLLPDHLQVDHPSAPKKGLSLPSPIEAVPFRLQISHLSSHTNPSAADRLAPIIEPAGEPQKARNSSEGTGTEASTATPQAHLEGSTDQQGRSSSGPTEATAQRG